MSAAARLAAGLPPMLPTGSKVIFDSSDRALFVIDGESKKVIDREASWDNYHKLQLAGSAAGTGARGAAHCLGLVGYGHQQLGCVV